MIARAQHGAFAAIAAVALAIAAPAQRPALHVIATDAAWLAPFVAPLQLTPQPLAAGECYELIVAGTPADANRGSAANATPVLRHIAAAPASGAPTLLTVTADPSTLRGAHAANWTEQRTAWIRLVTRLGTMLGFDTKAAATLAADAFDLAEQVDAVRLTITKGGEASAGVALQLSLDARPDTALAAWLRAAQPAATAAARWPDASLLAQLRVQLAAERFADVVAPFVPRTAALRGVDTEQITASLAQCDGHFTLAISDDALMLATGLRDAARFAAAEPTRRDADAAHASRHRLAIERTPAPAYRGIALQRTLVTSRDPLPAFESAPGQLEAFGGIVGDTWLQLGGLDARTRIERSIDDALAGRLRVPEPPTEWLVVDVDVARLRRALGSASQPIRTAAPTVSRLRLAASSVDDTLHVTLQLR